MDFQTIFFSSYEVAVSLIFGLLTVIITLKVLGRTFLRSADGDLQLRGNTAAGLVSAATVLSVLVLVHGSVLPSVDALRTMVLGEKEISFTVVAIAFGYFLVFYAISLVISLPYARSEEGADRVSFRESIVALEIRITRKEEAVRDARRSGGRRRVPSARTARAGPAGREAGDLRNATRGYLL